MLWSIAPVGIYWWGNGMDSISVRTYLSTRPLMYISPGQIGKAVIRERTTVDLWNGV